MFLLISKNNVSYLNDLQSLISFLIIIYYINIQSPNLDLKLGIKPKAGNFLSGKREGEWGGGGRKTEIVR